MCGWGNSRFYDCMDRSDEAQCQNVTEARENWGRPEDNSIQVLTPDAARAAGNFSEPLCLSLAGAEDTDDILAAMQGTTTPHTKPPSQS